MVLIWLFVMPVSSKTVDGTQCFPLHPADGSVADSADYGTLFLQLIHYAYHFNCRFVSQLHLQPFFFFLSHPP